MLVVFEGIDGSGKTTVSNRIAERLRATGLRVEHLREGGKFVSRVTQGIREFGRDARNWELLPEAEFFLYVTRDVQLLEETTRPALSRADVVFADRYLYSAEVLARCGRGLPESLVRPVLEAACRGLIPDLVVLVDVDPHLARARRWVAKQREDDRRPPSRKGLGGRGLQQRLRAGYLELAARAPERWTVVDNGSALEATVERIAELVSGALREGVATALARFRATAPVRAEDGEAPATPAAALARFLSWIDERARIEPHAAAYFLGGLYGEGVDARRRALAGPAGETVLGGLTGLDDPVSWELRRVLRGRASGQVARSLEGLPCANPRAGELRAALASEAPLEVLLSCEGLDEEPAWDLRERFFDAHTEAAVGTLAGLGGPRAWALRERWLARAAAAAFGSYQGARAACRSVTGLDEDRAWRVREAARAEAPIAALASLAGIGSERAWSWRRQMLARTPKTVFATLEGSDDDRAWEMREAMAQSCEQAVDSLKGMDGQRAWRLRSSCADLWPSTVVKSLGPLARTQAGQDMAERLLRAHPGNLSLLKHASAIALGLDPGGAAQAL